MNLIMNSTKKVIRLIDIRKQTISGKIIKPCSPRCLCLMFLNLSEKESQIYYEHCYRTKIKY